MKAAESPWTQAGSLPGWGIVADLTPPELIASRRLKVIRRLMVLGFALVVLLCAGGYGYAIWDNGKAADGLTAEQDRTTSLIAEQRRYSGVTVVRGAIADVTGQLSGLMAGDVNVGTLVRSVVTALPKGMTIDQLAVTLTAGKAGATSGSTTGGVGSLDMSAATHIGSVTLTGTGSKLTDLAAYVNALRSAPGVFEPYPLSNQEVATATGTGTTYSLQLTLTDALLTHRFDVTGGGK